MKPKTLPPGERAQGEQSQDDMTGPSATLKNAARRRLLGEIADMLQVPLATLYSARSPLQRAQGNDGGALSDDLDHECELLLHAYKRISDPERRRRLLALAQGVAERS